MNNKEFFQSAIEARIRFQHLYGDISCGLSEKRAEWFHDIFDHLKYIPSDIDIRHDGLVLTYPAEHGGYADFTIDISDEEIVEITADFSMKNVCAREVTTNCTDEEEIALFVQKTLEEYPDHFPYAKQGE